MIASPFPYFDSKSSIADVVWSALGDVDVYCEPFFGSGAVLLARPHAPRIEHVNDLDANIANFWRAVQADPEAVARYADWPVNEVDLEARHKWLCRMPEKADFARRMKDDPDLFDAKRAGWWCWGLCAWIGSGWCAGEWFGADDERNKKCRRRLPELSASKGVNRASGGKTCAERTAWLVAYFMSLRDRIRRTKVCCGDWSCVVASESTTTKQGTCGVFLDPPYSAEAGRANDLYAEESMTVAHDVREWCIENQTRRDLRIVLAGYDVEHASLERHGWRVHKWKARGGMANQSEEGSVGRANAHRERLWISPSCIESETLWKAN